MRLPFTMKRKSDWRHRLLFISAPIVSNERTVDTLDYFAAIISEITIRLSIALPEYDLVIKVPEGGEKAGINQRAIVNDIYNTLKINREEYSGIILSPYDKNEIRDLVVDLSKITNVFLLDQGYYTDDERKFFKNYAKVERPPFVQSDWEKSGEAAGNSMRDYFIEKRITDPKILIFKGLLGSDERAFGFARAFKNKGKINPNIYYADGGYRRDKTKKAFEHLLQKAISDNTVFDGIFATNDEMALGVRQVLIDNKGKLGNKHPIIIGFDGIRDLTAIIEGNNPDEFVYDTVDVHIFHQIKKLVDIIVQKLNGEKHNELWHVRVEGTSFLKANNDIHGYS